MKLTITDDAAAKLRALLDSEGGDAVVRVREAKVGAGWKAKLVLMLSIDEREDEDLEGEVNSLPFVINEELSDQYGEDFAISLDEATGLPSVAVLN